MTSTTASAARVPLTFGAIGVALVGGALLLAGVPLLDTVVLAFLLAALPALAIAQARLIGDEPIERIPAYLSSFVTLALLGVGVWWVGSRPSGMADVSMGPVEASTLLIWTCGMLAGGVGIVFAFKRLAMGLGLPEAPVVRKLMPRTGRERVAFAALSVAAGFGEEIAYRGYAITALAPLVGVGGAVAVTSSVFGVLHVYQGPLGIVRTGLLGLMLAGGFVATGSLWPAIVAHTSINVVVGSFAEHLMVPEAAEAQTVASGEASERD